MRNDRSGQDPDLWLAVTAVSAASRRVTWPAAERTAPELAYVNIGTVMREQVIVSLFNQD